jgi:hypothetical protein
MCSPLIAWAIDRLVHAHAALRTSHRATAQDRRAPHHQQGVAARAPEPKGNDGNQGQAQHQQYAAAEIMSLLSRVPNTAQRQNQYQAGHSKPISPNQNLPDRHKTHSVFARMRAAFLQSPTITSAGMSPKSKTR